MYYARAVNDLPGSSYATATAVGKSEVVVVVDQGASSFSIAVHVIDYYCKWHRGYAAVRRGWKRSDP